MLLCVFKSGTAANFAAVPLMLTAVMVRNTCILKNFVKKSKKTVDKLRII